MSESCRRMPEEDFYATTDIGRALQYVPPAESPFRHLHALFFASLICFYALAIRYASRPHPRPHPQSHPWVSAGFVRLYPQPYHIPPLMYPHRLCTTIFIKGESKVFAPNEVMRDTYPFGCVNDAGDGSVCTAQVCDYAGYPCTYCSSSSDAAEASLIEVARSGITTPSLFDMDDGTPTTHSNSSRSLCSLVPMFDGWQRAAGTCKHHLICVCSILYAPLLPLLACMGIAGINSCNLELDKSLRDCGPNPNPNPNPNHPD